MTLRGRILLEIRAAPDGTTSERISRVLGVRQASVTTTIGWLGRHGLVRSIYGPIGPGYKLASGEMVYAIKEPA